MQLNFKEFGAGTPVIIVHGLFGMLDNWQSFARQLGRDYRVYTVDMRNHGRSPHSDDISYPLMAEDLLAFMDQHGIGKAHLVGHSMGGKVVMQTALNTPVRVSTLTAVDIAPKAYQPGHNAIMDAMESIAIDKADRRAEVEQELARQMGSVRIARFLMKNLNRRDKGGFEWKLNLPAIRNHYEQIIGAIDAEGKQYDGPVLFMRGAESDYVTESDREDILAVFPKAVFVAIKGAGHWLHADQPDRTLTSLRYFLEEAG